MKKPLLFILSWILIFPVHAQWWPEVRVTNDDFTSNASLNRIIAACGDTVHMTWYDNCQELGRPAIHYVRSLDAGLNWDTEQQITFGPYYDEEPSISAAGPFVHIAYMNHEFSSFKNTAIHYKRSTNGGESWEETVALTNNEGYKYYPSVAADGNFVHLVWYDDCADEWEIYYLRSSDGGATWDEKVRLTNQPDISAFCTVAASGRLVHVVWQDWRDGHRQVYYKRSGDYGATWSDDLRITHTDFNGRFPDVAACGAFVQLVWQDDRDGNYEIYGISSIDGGLSWQQETRLTDDVNGSEYVSISTSGAESFLAWQDLRSGLSQIYFKNGHNYGTTWDEDERLINTWYKATHASIANSGDWLHVVWKDERDGNNEIYCKNKYLDWNQADTVRLSVNDAEVSESSGQIIITVTLAGNIRAPLSIDYATGSGSATSGIDFAGVSGTLVYPAGATTGYIQTIEIPVIDDHIAEQTESFTLVLSHLVCSETAVISDGQGVCNILDNDSYGIAESSGSEDSFLLYPNPARSQLTVDGGQLTAGGRDPLTNLRVFDIRGSILKDIGNLPAGDPVIDISDLPNGLYFLQVCLSDGTSGTRKFLKIK